jgi:hypothetical protein
MQPKVLALVLVDMDLSQSMTLAMEQQMMVTGRSNLLTLCLPVPTQLLGATGGHVDQVRRAKDGVQATFQHLLRSQVTSR